MEDGKLELATDDLKHRNYHVKKDNNLIQNKNDDSRQQKKMKLKLSRVFYMSFFLILSGNVTMCAENKTTMNIETNNILRKDTKIEHYNKTGEQRLDKRHISGDFPSIRVAGNPSKNCDRISPI